METVIEFFERVNNYTDSHGVWAENLDPNSKIVLGQVENGSGNYLPSVIPEGWHYLGRIDQIMDAKEAWHEGITDFDPCFVDDYLYSLKNE